MKYIMPEYYGDFRCLDKNCPYSCCKGWQISIDAETLKKYSSLKGPFANRLKNSVDWENGCFRQYQGSCVMLNEQGLCDIYTEAGPSMLCGTCRDYPRHKEEYEGAVELSLSLSCVEAARIILEHTGPVRFLTRELSGKEETFYGFDRRLYRVLLDARNVIFGMLQSDRDLPEAMAAVLRMGRSFQRHIDAGDLDGAKRTVRYCRERFLAPAGRTAGRMLSGRADEAVLYRNMRRLAGLFAHMEPVDRGWRQYLKQSCRVLYGMGPEAYAGSRSAFLKETEGDPWRQLLVYFIYTYFCGAVYDRRAYEKIKLAHAMFLMIRELAQAFWMQNGELKIKDLAGIAGRCSREAEHSDRNLAYLERALLKDRGFHMDGLLGCTGTVDGWR